MNYSPMLKNISLWGSLVGFHVILITLTGNQTFMGSIYIYFMYSNEVKLELYYLKTKSYHLAGINDFLNVLFTINFVLV